MKILLAVDCQNSFMPGGALPVPGGDEIVPIINSIRDKFDKVIWTKDWHPVNHVSFKPMGQWPTHCVQDTIGAELHMDLIIKPEDIIITKGTDPAIDSYSGFYDNEKGKATELVSLFRRLQKQSWDEVEGKLKIYVVGLATNFCVLYTVLDALREDYETYIVLDACRGIDINIGDIQKAQEEMVDAGALITSSKAILTWR